MFNSSLHDKTINYCTLKRTTNTLMILLKRKSHIATVEGKLKEVRGTISNHVLEGVVIQAKILQQAHERVKVILRTTRF